MGATADKLPDLSFDQMIELERRAAARERGDGGGAAGGDDGDHGGGSGDEAGDDDTITLPWWQHPVNIVTMVFTAAALAAMIGWLVGDSAGRPSHNAVDTGFLQDMREHHEQAVYMSFVFRELDGTRPGLGTVAGSIIIGQSQEIGRMVQLLRDFGETEANEGETSMAWMGMPTERGAMPGMASEADLDRLAASSGDQADRLFAELMIAHHEGGIHMAEYATEHGKNDEVRKMAASMARGQREEIAELRNLLD